jgi:hypothetical protein
VVSEAVVTVAAPVQGEANTTQGVVFVHPLLGKVLRMKVPTILLARRVIISSITTPASPLIVLAIDFCLIQLNSTTDLAAEVAVVVAAEVITEVTAGVAGMVLATDNETTTVVALQARRTHLCFS